MLGAMVAHHLLLPHTATRRDLDDPATITRVVDTLAGTEAAQKVDGGPGLLLDLLEALMPPGTTWTRPDGGFYVWLKLPHGLDAKLMQPRAVNAHVAYVPGIGFYADGQGREYMRLSYCFPEPDRIREGVRRLARVIEAELDLHATFDAVDTGTFRLPRPAERDTPSIIGPANSDQSEDHA